MEKINRCRTCKNRIRRSSGKRYAYYCEKIHNERTRCGYQLIKSNQPACRLYEYGAISIVDDRFVQLSIDFNGK